MRSAAAALIIAWSTVAFAHGFGERFDLPVPLWLYLLGAGSAVLLSFVVVAYFLRAAPPRRYPRLDLLRVPVVRLLAAPAVVATIRVASVLVFLLVVVAGLIGTSQAERNVAPLVVWVLWWVGVAYASALVGDVWRLLNPWKILFEWAEAGIRRVDPEAEVSLNVRYPPALGVWPAVALFLAFAWLELAYPGAARPFTLASAALVYSGITWGGMIVFGKHAWLSHGEAFTLVFGLLARFAPTEIRVKDASNCQDTPARDPDGGCVGCWACFEAAPASQRELNLRPFAVGLRREEHVPGSLMVATLLLLSTVTFDGFTATPLWSAIATQLYDAWASLTGITTLGLLVFPLIFLVAFLTVCAAMDLAAGVRRSPLVTARAFVLTLVPIALAYHLAHYLTYLLVQSQLVVPVASDPFGFGWDLFGTAERSIDVAVVGPRFAWFVAVIAIVAGHIVSVYLAHVVAMRRYPARAQALRSQVPMMILMVGYTVISLWILAQPIVTPPAPP